MVKLDIPGAQNEKVSFVIRHVLREHSLTLGQLQIHEPIDTQRITGNLLGDLPFCICLPLK